MHIGKIVSLQQDGLSATMKAWKGSAEDVPGGTPPSTSSKTGGKNYEKTAQHPFGACTGHGPVRSVLGLRLRLAGGGKHGLRQRRGRRAGREKRQTCCFGCPPFAAGDDGALDKEFWTETLAPWAAENNVDLTIEITPWGNYEEKIPDGFFLGRRPGRGLYVSGDVQRFY